VTRFFCCWIDPSGASCHTSSVDRELKDYIKNTFRVKTRTLQRWMKAGVVPGVYRTKGGHYRIRSPKGMTPEKLTNFSTSRLLMKQRFDVGGMDWLGVAMLSERFGAGPEFVTWVLTLERNVRDYTFLMRPIWQHERNTGAKVAFYTLNELRALAKGSAILRETTSRRNVADFLSSFEPMGANPLERVQ
jgi:hypothetical protein